jgi:hypothetical protein
MKQIKKSHAFQVKLLVEKWHLNRAAKGANAGNQKSFEKLLAFPN